MHNSRLAVLSVVLLRVSSGFTTSELSQEVIDYTTSLIQYLSELNYGTFDCWFYESRSAHRNTVLDSIVTSDKLSAIPRRMLLGSGPVQVIRRPTMLVMFSENYRAQKVMQFLWQTSFNQYMWIIVFYSTTAQYHSAAPVFRIVFLHNVIFLQTDRLSVRYFNVFKNEHHDKRGSVPFEEIFVDQTRDLGGYVVKISTFSYRQEVHNRKIEHIFEWVSEAVTRMNASYRFYPIECTDLAECARKSLFINSSHWYDFCIDQISLEQISYASELPSTVPGKIGIAVPRGRELTAIEIFLVPFKFNLWFALAILLVSCYSGMLSGAVQNDLILLALCGFERTNLLRVSRSERLIAAALVILFFLLKCAYESKLVAVMTSVPHLEDPHTMEDLVRANITIRNVSLNETIHKGIDDPRLAQVFKTRSTSVGQFNQWDLNDRTKAYFGEYDYLNAALRHPALYDHQAKRSRFVLLEKFTSLNIIFHLSQYRSALSSRLTWYERAFLEAGLLHTTADKIAHVFFGLSYQSQENDLEATKVVGIAELLPAWYALAFGWSAAGLVLTLELSKKAWDDRYRRLIFEAFGTRLR